MIPEDDFEKVGEELLKTILATLIAVRVSQNKFVNKIFNMTEQEVMDYAQAHGMTMEDFLFLLSDTITDINNNEALLLAKELGIDYDNTLGNSENTTKQ